MSRKGISKKMKKMKKIHLIFLISVIFHIIYIIFASWDCTFHDLGNAFDLTNRNIDPGHIGYIKYLYQYHQLPDFDVRIMKSYYNPPFYHSIAALWLGINQFLGVSDLMCTENLQILSLIFTTAGMYVGCKILKEFELNETAETLMAALFLFHPIFTTLSGAVNSDSLATMFSLMTILYTIRWYKSHSWSNIGILALCIGLGMCTKLSVGLLSPAVAVVFLLVLIREHQNWKCLMKQFVVFGIICIPLGIGIPMRNYLLWGVPLNYVPRLPDTDKQYIGQYSILQRVGLPRLFQLKELYVSLDAKTEYNIWMEMFRTAVLDEKKRGLPGLLYDGVLYMEIWCSMLLAILMNILSIIQLKKKQGMDLCLKIFWGFAYLFLLGNYIVFCFQYPHICTMNFRYIVCTVIFPTVLTGQYLSGKHKMNKAIEVAAGAYVLLSAVTSIALIMGVA